MTREERLAAIKILALDVDGVLTDGSLYIGNEGELCKSFNAKDGLGISVALRNGLDIAIITGRKSAIIHRRAAELGITSLYEGVKDKHAVLTALSHARKLQAEQIAYMGDDLNDLPAFAAAGLALAPADAVAEVGEAADIVMLHAGGRGAVREAIEMILQAQGKWDSAVEDYKNVKGLGDKQ